MIRKLILPLIILFLIILFVYILIPGTIKLSAVTHIKCTTNELNTCLHDETKWQRWFPVNKNLNGLEEFEYVVKEKKLNGIDLDIINNKYKLHSSLVGLSLTTDSLMVNWSAEIINDLNPITRVKHYFFASDVENKMNIILDSLRSFASQTINIYGFNIQRTGFDDSLLLSTRNNYNSVPDLKEQYRLIYNLQNYIQEQGAVIIDSPMVHISSLENTFPGSTGYRIQIAVALDRPIKETKDFSLIRMVHINGKYVAADVKGGPLEIKKAHEQIESYMKDHFLTSPGIPFEIYLTDRLKQPDSSKWMTRIYHPST